MLDLCLGALFNLCNGFNLQGIYKQDVSNVRMLHMMCTISNSQSCYSSATLSSSGRELTSRLLYASSFPVVHLSRAPSVNCRRMMCVNAMAKVSNSNNLITFAIQS